VSVGIVLSTGVQEADDADGQEGANDMVVLRRAVFLKVRRSECGMDEQTLRSVRDGTARWGELILDAMRRIVYRSAPPAPTPQTEKNPRASSPYHLKPLDTVDVDHSWAVEPVAVLCTHVVGR
jgi:hypothetical protein